jgi:GTP cyclohydrolase III
VLTCWNFARKSKINVRENQRGNQEWTIQRNWQQDATILHVQECIHKHVDICGTQRMSVTHFIRYDQSQKIERPNNLRDFQSIKQTTKGLNMIALKAEMKGERHRLSSVPEPLV